MNSNREQFFALGVALGTAVGLIVGSIIAFHVGEEGIDTLRRTVERVLRHEDHPKFELLLQ